MSHSAGIHWRRLFGGAALVCAAWWCLRAGQAPAPSQSGFVYNGITHVSWQSDEYNHAGKGRRDGTNSRAALAATRANWAGVLVTQFQDSAQASRIYADPHRTPTDEAVTLAIRELHASGLQVMLKPHVDSQDGVWRGTFRPADVDAWFRSFTVFALHYAQLAQSLKVELFCFGTEYAGLSGMANRERWDAVIAAIRRVYTGKLVYAANAISAGDEFATVSFWDKLDLLGVDGYVPLTDHPDPALGELIAAWRNNRSGENPLAALRNLAEVYRKPLIFTEIGYRSVAGANTRPYEYSQAGAPDPAEQANCYAAFYYAWIPQNSWMQGAFWWDWPVAPPAAADTDYTARNKPAGRVLKAFQGPPAKGCDIGGTGAANIGDLQLVMNQALGILRPVNDLNRDAVLNVADIQSELNAARGQPCPVR